MTSVEPPGQIALSRGVDRVLDSSWRRSAETGQHLRRACNAIQRPVAAGLGVVSWLRSAYRALSRSRREQIAERAGMVTDCVRLQVNLLDSIAAG
jgi:hypothetical protein